MCVGGGQNKNPPPPLRSGCSERIYKKVVQVVRIRGSSQKPSREAWASDPHLRGRKEFPALCLTNNQGALERRHRRSCPGKRRRFDRPPARSVENDSAGGQTLFP